MELTDIRYTLAMDRIREIPGENMVEPGFIQHFEDGAEWLLLMEEEERFLLSEDAAGADIDLLKRETADYTRKYCRIITIRAGPITVSRLRGSEVKWAPFRRAAI